jgi:hypothetical protein
MLAAGPDGAASATGATNWYPRPCAVRMRCWLRPSSPIACQELIRSTVTGDIDLHGILGLNPDVRNGYERVAVRFTVKGDAPAEKLREIVAQSQARSAVYDIITNRVPVTIEVETA